MKLKTKLILIISLVLSLIVVIELVIGESYFVNLFKYSKAKELEKIDFISKNKIDFIKLKDYQKSKNAFVIIFKDNNIINIENFDYIKINTNEGKKVLLLNAFLDNLYSEHKLTLKLNDKISIKALRVLKNYYIPINMIKNNQEFKDYKLNKSKLKKYKFTGNISEIGNSNFNSTKGDDLLEALLELKLSENQNKNYIEQGEDEFQLVSKKIGKYQIVIFYSYEDINDIFPTLKIYFYIKGILLILLTLIIGKLLENIIIKPIENLSKITNNISKLKFISKTHIKSCDEIGQLYKDIINMSNKLESIIELYKEESNSNKNLNIKLEESIKFFMHEVKTPLSVIIGFSDLLLLNNSSEELDIINKEGKRLLNLSNELLLENTEKNSVVILNKKYFDIISLVELANKICEAEKNKINLTFKNINYLQVFGDPEKIEQVILNILKNAMEHTKDAITINLQEFENKIYLLIENNGSQFSEKELECLWDKFYTTNGSGRGLGLYICAKILNKHNSDFGVKNIKGGVQFYFSLNKFN